MAYLREITEPCKEPGCVSRATVELLDRWNGALGTYCRPHGKKALARQAERERATARKEPS